MVGLEREEIQRGLMILPGTCYLPALIPLERCASTAPWSRGADGVCVGWGGRCLERLSDSPAHVAMRGGLGFSPGDPESWVFPSKPVILDLLGS